MLGRRKLEEDLKSFIIVKGRSREGEEEGKEVEVGEGKEDKVEEEGEGDGEEMEDMVEFEEEDGMYYVVQEMEEEGCSDAENLVYCPEQCEEEQLDMTPSEGEEPGVEGRKRGVRGGRGGRERRKGKAPCPFCNKMLYRVDEHIRLLHRNKMYVCEKTGCGNVFATLKNLQSHQLQCLGMEKSHECAMCGKQFHRKSNYKAHIRRHDLHKQFVCRLCERTFVDTTGLRRHFLKHHETEQPRLMSACCGKVFRSKEGLRKHVERRVCGKVKEEK